MAPVWVLLGLSFPLPSLLYFSRKQKGGSHLCFHYPRDYVHFCGTPLCPMMHDTLRTSRGVGAVGELSVPATWHSILRGSSSPGSYGRGIWGMVQGGVLKLGCRCPVVAWKQVITHSTALGSTGEQDLERGAV